MERDGIERKVMRREKPIIYQITQEQRSHLSFLPLNTLGPRTVPSEWEDAQ